jgi:hypothetical protein
MTAGQSREALGVLNDDTWDEEFAADKPQKFLLNLLPPHPFPTILQTWAGKVT